MFDTLPADEAREQLLSCCAAPGWATAVTAGRPYRDRDALAAQAREQVTLLPWSQVAQAVAAHPRIGQPPAGDSREASWSRREQSAAADGGRAAADDTARAELIILNEAYEQRFGYRFLIFANGRGAAELAAAARQRLRHDDDTERAVVRTELGDIAALRVGRLLDDLAQAPAEQTPADPTPVDPTSVDASPPRYAPLSTHVLDTATGTPAPDLPVRLDVPGGDGGWRTVAAGRTDAGGRLRDWAPADRWDTGTYRLVFDVTDRLGADGFYTEIPVVFTVHDTTRHHHVPLLLSPYGYTTYRGAD